MSGTQHCSKRGYHRTQSNRSIESLGSHAGRPQQPNTVTMKSVRSFVYLLGLLSLVLILFMAQRLESRYGGLTLLDVSSSSDKRQWLVDLCMRSIVENAHFRTLQNR